MNMCLNIDLVKHLNSLYFRELSASFVSTVKHVDHGYCMGNDAHAQ